MKIRAVLQASQDSRNWTILDYDPPIPTAILTGYAYVRVALIYQAERGDAESMAFSPPSDFQDPQSPEH
jgi:hypothetical protein